jgi:hypothetical protein
MLTISAIIYFFTRPLDLSGKWCDSKEEELQRLKKMFNIDNIKGKDEDL